MFRVNVEASRGLRWGVLALAAVLLVAAGTDPADARYHRRHRGGGGGSYHPAYAAIVIDANSGEVLHAASADSPRHPASITKIMTLYLLFEQLEAGKLKLDSELAVSAEAASQAPTKLGLRPGQTIPVEEAIKGLVTKSANDAAVVIAEAIGGDQDSFAKMMTRKARALGMTNTVYHNASGLPDDEQLTTARDQAVLARAIQDRFPRYYRYVSTPSLSYHGHAMRNHNRLLGRVEGVDGIKTGYTRASGFNLVTSVRRGGRHLVAVVLGGTSAGARDARMRALIEQYIDDCATTRTAGRITERGETVVASAAPAGGAAAPAGAQDNLGRADDMRGAPVGQTTPAVQAATAPPTTTQTTPPTQAAGARPGPGSTEPIRPISVKTLTVRPGGVQTATLAPVTANQAMAAHGAIPRPADGSAYTLSGTAGAPPLGQTAGPPPGARPGVLGVLPGNRVATTDPVSSVTASATMNGTPAPEIRHSGWIVQIGAFPAEDEAKGRLKSAQSLAKRVLGGADAFTERVVKGEVTLYRARFAGLDEDSAEAACKYLKRNKIACFTVKN
jgi:D-alanyl-D-alanine carboxypeptidase